MTIIFSAATSDLIVLTVDEAITDTFEDGREYKRGRKGYHFDGIGCVATWGERRGNTLGSKLLLADLHANRHSFQNLDYVVEHFLHEEYRPDQFEEDLDDVGYHIAGFDRQGNAHLYHRFWGVPRPNPDRAAQAYGFSDHSPTLEKPLQLVYNGRNDIAQTIIHMLLHEFEADKDVGFELETPVGIACFGDFVARMAAELTPEVGPPFTTYLIAPENRIERIRNETFQPIDREKVAIAVRLLRVSGGSELAPSYRIHAGAELNPISQPLGIATRRTKLHNFTPDTRQSPRASAGTVTVFTPEPLDDNNDIGSPFLAE